MKKILSNSLLFVFLFHFSFQLVAHKGKKNVVPVLSDVTKVLTAQQLETGSLSVEAYKAQTEPLIQQGLLAPPDTALSKYARLWQKNWDYNLAYHLTLLEESSPAQQVNPAGSTSLDSERVAEKESISIYIDYSNITAGLELPGGNHPINPSGLANFLENERFCAEKQIVGSFPHAGHDIWKVWNQLGYRTRIANSGKEMFVDDGLHAQIFRLLLQKANASKNTIVLVTGDGNSNGNYSSFVECVIRAIELNHKVEICSWKQRLNKVYVDLADKYPRLITIRYLDTAKHKILNFSN